MNNNLAFSAAALLGLTIHVAVVSPVNATSGTSSTLLISTPWSLSALISGPGSPCEADGRGELSGTPPRDERLLDDGGGRFQASVRNPRSFMPKLIVSLRRITERRQGSPGIPA